MDKVSSNPTQQQPQACGCPGQTPEFICVDKKCPFYYTKRFFCSICGFRGVHGHDPLPPPRID